MNKYKEIREMLGCEFGMVFGFEMILSVLDKEYLGTGYKLDDMFSVGDEWESDDNWTLIKMMMIYDKGFDYVCRVKELCNLIMLDMDGIGKVDKVLVEINNWLNDFIDEKVNDEILD